MNVLVPQPTTRQGNQLVFTMTDRYTKFTKVEPTTKNNGTTVARMFLEHWVADYDIPSTLLTHNVPQFVSNVFGLMRPTVGMNNITTTENHLQTNGRAERFSSTLISR